MADRLSGHSTRVGAAQDMIACGIELPAILQVGRWKSTAMVNRYGAAHDTAVFAAAEYRVGGPRRARQRHDVASQRRIETPLDLMLAPLASKHERCTASRLGDIPRHAAIASDTPTPLGELPAKRSVPTSIVLPVGAGGALRDGSDAPPPAWEAQLADGLPVLWATRQTNTCIFP